MDSLFRKIISQVEQKQAHFRGLRGLRLTELKRIIKYPSESIIKDRQNVRSGSIMSSIRDSFEKTGDQSLSDIKDTSLLGNHPQKLALKTDEAILRFWNKNCTNIPIQSCNKIGDYLREGEHLLCKFDSVDMLCHIKLFMVQGKYNIDALMDLKIDKNMVLKDFKNLLQKLALQMWNRCVTVFKEQRSKAVQKSSLNFKLYSQETNKDLKRLSIFELQTIQNIFILTDI